MAIRKSVEASKGTDYEGNNRGEILHNETNDE
jgi:hypothetical protein